MDSIIFSLSKVPDAITERTVYTAHVQAAKIKNVVVKAA